MIAAGRCLDAESGNTQSGITQSARAFVAGT